MTKRSGSDFRSKSRHLIVMQYLTLYWNMWEYRTGTHTTHDIHWTGEESNTGDLSNSAIKLFNSIKLFSQNTNFSVTPCHAYCALYYSGILKKIWKNEIKQTNQSKFRLYLTAIVIYYETLSWLLKIYIFLIYSYYINVILLGEL